MFYITIGLIIGATLAGSAPSVQIGLAATGIFTLLGGGALFGSYAVLCGPRIFRRKANELSEAGQPVYVRVSLNSAVREGNLAAAILSGALVLGFGLMLRNAIAGDFAGWTSSIVGFGVVFVVALAMLVVATVLLDRFVVTSATIHEIVCEDHPIAASVMGMLIIAAALGVSNDRGVISLARVDPQPSRVRRSHSGK